MMKAVLQVCVLLVVVSPFSHLLLFHFSTALHVHFLRLFQLGGVNDQAKA